MNRLNSVKRTQIISALAEGNSLRATSRMTGASKVTILRLLEALGPACAAFQDKTLRNLTCKRIQCDEIWQSCYAKEKNVPADKRGQFGFGDFWTWAAMCADTKLIITWQIGTRGSGTAFEFMQDLAGRLAHRVQLTTDGHRVYLNAVESAFGAGIDYAMLIKIYGADSTNDTKYSPAECIDCKPIAITGRPDSKHISTSYIERQNLTMRMGMRRFTRLTNGFSKKVENHAHAVALHYMHYNFCRVHQTLRVTPAMEAGVADHVWLIEEMVALLDPKEDRIAA
jgi:IS1 family transposase